MPVSALRSCFSYTDKPHTLAMSNIESSFDEYKDHLVHMLHDRVDADLAMKIMYLERKLPDVDPRVDLDIEAKNEAAASNLKNMFAAKFGYLTSNHKNHLSLTGRINIEKLADIASHPDIEWISGSATPASY